MIKLTTDDLRYISLFERMTGAAVKDCVLSGEEVTFVIKEGEMGLAIGKKGATIEKVRKALGREVHVFEHSEDPKKFIANLMFPVPVDRVDIAEEGGKKMARVHVAVSGKRRVSVRGGKRMRGIRDMALRHFGIGEIKIM